MSVWRQDVDLKLEINHDQAKFEHRARQEIRKHALNPYNRLHSLEHDVAFVGEVREIFRPYPMLPNLRCGAWYCNPSYANGQFAHFKSADGHYNAWSFNLRRPNLHLLALVEREHGLVLIDSTRGGKRIPDSFAKTVPIWCAVINRALTLRYTYLGREWDSQLYTPPQCVSKQEHVQIEAKLDEWAKSLSASSYDLPVLEKPLRPIWLTPATTTYPDFGDDSTFFPVICVSASKIIDQGIEKRREGFSYVQGAGDDDEFWSSGLTPRLFWEHRDELLEASEDDLMEVLLRVVDEDKANSEQVERTKPETKIARVGGRLRIAAIADNVTYFESQTTSQIGTDRTKATPCIILRSNGAGKTRQLHMLNEQEEKDDHRAGRNTQASLELLIPEDKKSAERAFSSCLPLCLSFIKSKLQEGRNVTIACETGRDLSVGVAVAALQAFFDENGTVDLKRCDEEGDMLVTVNKDTIRTRLHWVIASRPEANPSRATMKRVNAFFLSSGHVK